MRPPESPPSGTNSPKSMYLKDSPSADLRLSKRASFSFARFQSTEGLPEIARPVVGERGFEDKGMRIDENAAGSDIGTAAAKEDKKRDSREGPTHDPKNDLGRPQLEE